MGEPSEYDKRAQRLVEMITAPQSEGPDFLDESFKEPVPVLLFFLRKHREPANSRAVEGLIQLKLTEQLTTHMSNLDATARWLGYIGILLAFAQVCAAVATLFGKAS